MATDPRAATTSEAAKTGRRTSRIERFERRVEAWRELDACDPRAVERRVVWLLRAAESLAPLALLVGLALCGVAAWLIFEALRMRGVPRTPGQGSGSGLVKLALAAGLFGLVILWQVVRAWILAHRVSDGVRVTHRTAPQLFERLSGIARKLSARMPDRVLLVDELTAATIAVPRMIPFTRPRIVLVLGVPLLELLSPPQFDSVVAHELAHQLPGEFKTSGRIGALVTFWSSIATKSEGRVFLLHSVIGWFVERLNAATLAVSRRIEFTCDAAASGVVGPSVACAALYRLAAYQELFNRWHREAVLHAVNDPTSTYRDAVRGRVAWFQAPPSEDARRRLIVSLRTPSDDLSSHPSLRERCEAILKTTLDPESVAVPSGSPPAMSVLFGQGAESSAVIANVVDASGSQVKEIADALRPARERLAFLDAEMAARAPSPERDPLLEGAIDEWLQVSAIVEPEERSIERARRATELRPTYGDAWAMYSALLLSEDREEGIAAAAEASRFGTMHSTSVASAIAAYYARQGRVDQARTAARLARRSAESDDEINQALVRAPKADEIVAHDLPPNVVAILSDAVRSVKGVSRVWLIGRAVPGLGGVLTYVLVTEPKFLSFRVDSDGTKAAGEVVSACLGAVTLPAAVVGFTFKSLPRRARKRVREVGKSLL